MQWGRRLREVAQARALASQAKGLGPAGFDRWRMHLPVTSFQQRAHQKADRAAFLRRPPLG